MAICPACKKKIEHLERWELATVGSKVFVDKTGQDLDLKEISFEPENVDFICPECRTELFDDGEEALKFLKGEKGEFLIYETGDETE